MSKKRLGFARIEFIACKQEIENLLTAGYTIIGVHEELTKQNKITMGYARFTQLLRNGVKRSKSTPPKEKEISTEKNVTKQHPQEVQKQQAKVLGVAETNSFKKSSSEKKDLI
ncbi:TraK family protein [Halodesulfovibrio aestuarii]|uniref:TraK family protein n=1 Tax=Halodesulfovibrio aestuarii TaxID=126333 RepID=A0ABV4JVD3_9BACT